jgi:hypothetical protein
VKYIVYAMPQRQRGVLSPRLLAGLQARVHILRDGRLGGGKKVEMEKRRIT